MSMWLNNVEIVPREKKHTSNSFINFRGYYIEDAITPNGGSLTQRYFCDHLKTDLESEINTGLREPDGKERVIDFLSGILDGAINKYKAFVDKYKRIN